MSGPASSSMQGVRTAGAGRRDERRRSSRAKFGWQVHVVILVLAVLVWWIARQMVSVERTLQDVATVRFEIEESIREEWAIVDDPGRRISLKIAGPTAEINRFVSGLGSRENGFSYVYRVTRADVENLKFNDRHRASLKIDLRRFELDSDSSEPPELKVERLPRDATFTVTLEQFIARDAVVDLTDGVTGRLTAYRFTQSVVTPRQLEVYGPAGIVESISEQRDGVALAVLRVAAEGIESIVRDQAQVAGKEFEEILKGGHLVSSFSLLPIEGLKLRHRESHAAVNEVPVRLKIDPLRHFVQVSGAFPVSVQFPNWLLEKGATVEKAPIPVQVTMEVLGDMKGNFSDKYVSVKIDLSRFKESDVRIEAPEGGGPGPRKVKFSNIYYSLDINEEKLTYRFLSDKVTARKYRQTEIEVVWTE